MLCTKKKFDCDEHARRFDLIRSSRPMPLLFALSYARERRSLARRIASARATTIIGDVRNIRANQESSELAPVPAQKLCGRTRTALQRSEWRARALSPTNDRRSECAR